MEIILFYAFAGVALGGAIGVVAGRSPVASLLFMVATLSSVAAIYVMLEAHFLAAIQVMVYAGAIMVLFLFVIMLLNLGRDYRTDVKSGGWMIAAFAATGAMAGVLVRRFGWTSNNEFYARFDGPARIDAAVREQGAVGAFAEPLLTDYVVAFELTGILLLVAIVAAVVLAKPRTDREHE